MNKGWEPGYASIALTLLGAILLSTALLITVLLPPSHQLFAPVSLGIALLAVALAVLRGLRTLAILILGVMVFSSSFTAVRVSASVTFSDLCLAASLAAFSVLAIKNGRFRISSLYLFLAIGSGLILLGGVLGTIFGAPSPVASFIELAKLVLTLLILPLVFLLWDPDRFELRLMVWVWIGGVSVNVAAGLVEAQSSNLNRSYGLTLHPNTLGLAALMALGPALALASTSSGMVRWAASVSTLLTGIGILISGSRVALGGAMVTIFLFLVLTRKFRLIVLFGVLGVVAYSLLMSPFVHLPEGNALARLIASSDQTSALNVTQSNLERHRLLEEAVANWSEHPLTGVGFENAVAAHNLFVQILSSGGPIAFIGYLLGMFTLLFPAFRAFGMTKAKLESREAVLLVGMCASVAGYIAGAPFQNALWERFLWIIPAMIVILAPNVRNGDMNRSFLAVSNSPRTTAGETRPKQSD